MPIDKQTVDRLICVLEMGGARDIRLDHGGKHPCLVFVLNGEPRRVIVAGSPSDRRAEANQIAYIRRMVRPPKTEATVNPRRRRRQRIGREPDAPAEFTTRPDPWAKLQALLKQKSDT